MTTDNNDLNLVLGDHPIFSEEVTEPAEPVIETPTEGEPVANQEDEEQYFVRLDRRDLQKQLLDFVNQDPDARQIYNRSVGNQAAKRYAPRIAELEGHVSTYQQLLQRERFSKLSQEEINDKFASDPEFARQYADIAHSTVEEPNTTVDIQAINQNLIANIQSIISTGQRQGLNEQDLRDIATGMQQGTYDKDEFGNDLPPTQWREVLENLQADVIDRVARNRVGALPPPTPPAESTTPVVTHSDTASPDLSAAGQRGVRTNAMTIKQFNQMSWDDQIAFTGDKSVEQMVAEGKITIEGT